MFFAPHATDYQTSHDEVESYFIDRGSEKIVIADDKLDCETGDAFFVAAKA